MSTLSIADIHLSAPHTTILVNERLPKDLANIVLGYFKCKERDWERISTIGEYETCLQIPEYELSYGLHGACLGGHMEIAQLMISKGANYWNLGLHGACLGGHMEIAQLMISKGANYWNYGLYGACRGGHMKLVNFMISKGANDWKWGLYYACCIKHAELMRLMISKGAKVCLFCHNSIDQH